MVPTRSRSVPILTYLLAICILFAGAMPAFAQTPMADPATPVAGRAPDDLGWAEDAVCYEIFVRSFYDSDGDGIGDLNGLIERLDYVNDGDPSSTTDLGANCIWLMPIFESTSYHGYDVEDYYTIDPDYGTNDDFRQLVAAADERGIKIILDLVLNHTSSLHPWFIDSQAPDSPYRDWYVWEDDDPDFSGPSGFNGPVWHPSPAGDDSYYYGLFIPEMPDLNFRNPEVTAEARKISTFWLEEMGADGFRLDAIKHLIEDGEIQENSVPTFAWLREYGAWMRERHPDAFTIGEIFGASTTTLGPYFPDQLDAYFQFEWSSQILGAADGGFGAALPIILNNTLDRLPNQRFAPFLTNHDQTRSMTVLGNDIGKAKVAATLLLTLPGIPFIYYGEEIGITGDKPDENLRTPMQWTADAVTGGFTTGTPWRPPQPDTDTVNVAQQADDPDSLLSLYRQLINVHTNSPALNHGDFIALSASPRVVVFLRHDRDTGQIVLVIVNLSDEPLTGDDLTIELGESVVPAGTYTLDQLFGPEGEAAQGLIVAEGGAIAAQAPMTELAPQSGSIFALVSDDD